MPNNYLGKLLFNDPANKFIHQKERIKTLTENNDIKFATLDKDNKYFVVIITKAGDLKQDIFQSSSGKSFACLKANYEKTDARDLFSYINVLQQKFTMNCIKNKPQTFYQSSSSTALHEISKDEFFRT